LPIGSFSEHVVEINRDLDLENIESLVKIVATALGLSDIKGLINAGLKMSKQTKLMDRLGKQIGVWIEPKKPYRLCYGCNVFLLSLRPLPFP
jgi:hypothetical protein